MKSYKAIVGGVTSLSVSKNSDEIIQVPSNPL
jgi:hypothetical protein